MSVTNEKLIKLILLQQKKYKLNIFYRFVIEYVWTRESNLS